MLNSVVEMFATKFYVLPLRVVLRAPIRMFGLSLASLELSFIQFISAVVISRVLQNNMPCLLSSAL